jgi:hypothetical protein
VSSCQEWLSREFPESTYLPAASSLAAELDKRALEQAEVLIEDSLRSQNSQLSG